MYQLVPLSSNGDDHSKALQNLNTTNDTTKLVFPRSIYFSTYQLPTKLNMEIPSKHHQWIYPRGHGYYRGRLKPRWGVILRFYTSSLLYIPFSHIFILDYLILLIPGHESSYLWLDFLSLTHVLSLWLGKSIFYWNGLPSQFYGSQRPV
jgi:hypothetical protein